MHLVEALGFGSESRVVVVHVDDVGMSGAANRGALEALEGAATCGSIMVPCPGFDEIAKICRDRPELDLGVHLTLNAEYSGYRWAPVRDDVPGLVSPDGGMWRTSADTVAHASPDEVERELRAQIDRALDAGIDVTHIDSHMGTVFDLKFAAIYMELARDYRLPLFIPRVRREILERQGFAPGFERYVALVDGIERDGFAVFDHFDANSLGFTPGEGLAHNTSRVQGFGPGLSYLITHCAEGGEELESITGDWQQRAEEHRLYSGPMRDVLEREGVHTIGMRPLRDLLRRSDT